MTPDPTEAQIDSLIEELGDICHVHYLGCSQNSEAPDGFEYSYDNEVINLLGTPEVKAKLQLLVLEGRFEEAKHWEHEVIPTVRTPQFEHRVWERITELDAQVAKLSEAMASGLRGEK